MPLHTETLTTAWYQLEDLDDNTYVMVAIEGDDCQVGIDAVEPPAGSSTITLAEGLQRLDIPTSKYLWFKSAGTTDITYSQFGGVLMDASKCGQAFSDSITSGGVGDEGFVGDLDPIIGFDDITVPAYEWLGFLHTVPAGIAGAGTVDSAVLSLEFSKVFQGETIRVHGVAETTSQFSTLADWSDLATGLTLTTAFADLVVGYNSVASVDITAILQELVDLSGWDASSPVQLKLLNTGTLATGVDNRVTIFRQSRRTVIFANVS
jgi:hypothetical protein